MVLVSLRGPGGRRSATKGGRFVKLLCGRLRWALVFWMFIIGAISFLDRVNISIAGQAVQRDFGLSNVQLAGVYSNAGKDKGK